jgi:OOP family OmpA-OmpF porin
MHSLLTSGKPSQLALAVVAALAALASPLASADDTGWYSGVNVGRSLAKIDDPRISASLQRSGFVSSSITDDDRATGFKLYGGYQFNRYFALEGGYFDLGKFGYTATTVPAGTLRGDIRLKGLNLDTVGILPLTDRLSAFGRIGVAYADARDTFRGDGAVVLRNSSASKRQANIKFGVGMQYAVTDALAMRVEAERYRVNDAIGNRGDVDLVSLGLLYRFGPRAAPVAMTTVMPEPVAVVVPAPAPAPIVAAPPPPRMVKKVSFSADSLFNFGKSSMTTTGHQAVAQFATDIKGTDYDTIKVTGHTDRIGSHASNLKLSQRRANTVKADLIDAGGIPANKITAVGVDGADPVTKPGDCKGRKVTPKLIACLQPDRRVDIEVSGTK